jgi:hypothetical protein
MDSKAMLPRAVKELCGLCTPGTAFYADGNGRNNIRLSFPAPPTPEFIREGIRRLSAIVINGELDLLKHLRRPPRWQPSPEAGIAGPPSNIGC